MEKLYRRKWPRLRAGSLISSISAGILGCVLSIILNHERILTFFFAGVTACSILVFVLMIINKEFEAVYIDDEGVRYKDIFMSWNEINITLYSKNKYIYNKVIIFNKQYVVSVNQAREEMRFGCCLYMCKSYLEIVTKYCKTKIKAIGRKSTLEELGLPPDWNKIIYEFNKKFDGKEKHNENATITQDAEQQDITSKEKTKKRSTIVAMIVLSIIAIVLSTGAVLMRLGYMTIGVPMFVVASLGLIVLVVWIKFWR